MSGVNRLISHSVTHPNYNGEANIAGKPGYLAREKICVLYLVNLECTAAPESFQYR
jgi:hypothetical protein